MSKACGAFTVTMATRSRAKSGELTLEVDLDTRGGLSVPLIFILDGYKSSTVDFDEGGRWHGVQAWHFQQVTVRLSAQVRIR